MKPIIIDAHLDMAYNACALGRNLLAKLDDLRTWEARHPVPDSQAGTAMVTLPELRAGRVAVAGASLYVEPGRKSHPTPHPTYSTPEQANRLAVQQLDYYLRLSDEQDDVVLLRDNNDLEGVLTSWKEDKPVTGLFIVMEGAEPILDPDDVGWWVERGLRGIGLTWSAGTRYAGGNANPGPLTDLGRDLLNRMADYNLILDISHLWTDAAFDVLERYPGPVIATHCNPRHFVDHPRMISDDLIRLLAERDGVMGMVACNPMIKAGWRGGDQRPPLERMVDLMDHVCQVTGSARHIAIGSDLDGGYGREASPDGLDSIADLQKFEGLLKARGYSEAQITGILSENWLRKMKETLAGF